MARKITTYRGDLLKLQVGERLHFKKKVLSGYQVTASQLKKAGLGLWKIHCFKAESNAWADRIE